MVYTSDGICPVTLSRQCHLSIPCGIYIRWDLSCYLIKAAPSIYPMWYIHQMGSDLLPYQGSAIYLSHVVYTSDVICPVTLSRQCHLSNPCGIHTKWDLTCYLIKAVPSIYPMWYIHQMGSVPVNLSRQCHLSIPCGIYITWDLSCYLIKAVPSIYPMWYIHQMGSVLLNYQRSAIYLSSVVYTSDGICPVTLSRQCHLSIPCGIYIRWDLSCYLIKAVLSIYPMWYIHQMGSELLLYQGSAIYLSHVVYTSDVICPVTLSIQCHLSIPCGIYIRWDLSGYLIKAAPSIYPTCGIYIRWDLTCYLIKAVPFIYPMWYIHQMGSVRLPYQGSAIYLSHVVYTSDGICPVTLSR